MVRSGPVLGVSPGPALARGKAGAARSEDPMPFGMPSWEMAVPFAEIEKIGAEQAASPRKLGVTTKGLFFSSGFLFLTLLLVCRNISKEDGSEQHLPLKKGTPHENKATHLGERVFTPSAVLWITVGQAARWD